MTFWRYTSSGCPTCWRRWGLQSTTCSQGQAERSHSPQDGQHTLLILCDQDGGHTVYHTYRSGLPVVGLVAISADDPLSITLLPGLENQMVDQESRQNRNFTRKSLIGPMLVWNCARWTCLSQNWITNWTNMRAGGQIQELWWSMPSTSAG